jgi:hypothetical protein
MKPRRIRPEAQRELIGAIRHDNGERRGLGKRFLNLVVQAFDRIQQDPLTGGPWDCDTRMLSLVPRRFPYGIIFKEYPAEILIVSVYHLHRCGNDWYDRLEAEGETG